MLNDMRYKKPELKLIFLSEDIIRTSELSGGDSGTGNSGGLPEETNIANVQSL